MIGGFVGHGVGDVLGGNAAVTYTLTADVGSFTETGNAALFDVFLLSSVGSFAETGIAALFDVTLLSAAGSFAETGQAALFDVLLLSSTGSYTLTGNTALFDVSLLSASGSYTLTGLDAGYQQTNTAAVSNTTVVLPVNCVLVETVRVSEWDTIFEEGTGAEGQEVTMADGGGVRLSPNTHSFSVTTRKGFH